MEPNTLPLCGMRKRFLDACLDHSLHPSPNTHTSTEIHRSLQRHTTQLRLFLPVIVLTGISIPRIIVISGDVVPTHTERQRERESRWKTVGKHSQPTHTTGNTNTGMFIPVCQIHSLYCTTHLLGPHVIYTPHPTHLTLTHPPHSDTPTPHSDTPTSL